MSWKSKIQGRVWTLGGNVDTDQIFPGYAMAAPIEKFKEYALAGGEIPDFTKKVQDGDIIVAGENFGCGSSREQAPVALKEAGVGLVIAKSFARIFRRNAINIGLPVLVCDLEQRVENGQEIEVDLVLAEVTICASGGKISGTSLASNVLETLEAGGLIAKVRKQLKIS
ncbi:3-isopropylmalate dehydratase [Desulfosporosinus fructosivorans]|uniref:3-isopropylmalate dehydratase small subunit n=1 Tax=Desulfosporosinus fructosivorans TaxID=2018669 RepID=A0A4Z0R7F9_9FIRM|nr:3-isopropylmalate dehydratase [Desulfosporosinus fructosivorans]TGE38063.1 3-isopropylmalate dehydratase [Desulfosporosinus fructosivorans]